MSVPLIRAVTAALLAFVLGACGGGGSGSGEPPLTGGPSPPDSRLSPVLGAEDNFGAGVRAAVLRAARSVPNGASQSSLAEAGRTASETTVRVVRNDEGKLVYEVSDGSRLHVQVPGPSRQGLGLALFTDLIPGIEPDLSSYPHEVLGIWAREEGEVGVFWSRSPSLPPVAFGPGTATATYQGDAVGLYATSGAMTKFLADVRMVADFGSRTVDGFRSLAGEAFGTGAVQLRASPFTSAGAPFQGETAMDGVQAGGKWGARWSDSAGGSMGGTFGIAADDDSLGILGAFTAVSATTH